MMIKTKLPCERGTEQEGAVQRETQCLREGAGTEGRKSGEGEHPGRTQLITRRTHLGEKPSQRKGQKL